jgi:hypothetical protein
MDWCSSALLTQTVLPSIVGLVSFKPIQMYAFLFRPPTYPRSTDEMSTLAELEDEYWQKLVGQEEGKVASRLQKLRKQLVGKGVPSESEGSPGFLDLEAWTETVITIV